MYAPDGRTAHVAESVVAAWKRVGWYDYPVQTMYTTDGRTAVISKSAVSDWKSVGWYEYPVTIVYAPDGRSSVIALSQLNAWKGVGWYEYPVTAVYAPDGRTAVISSLELVAWQNVGWSASYIPTADIVNRYTNYTWWDIYSQRCHMEMTYLYGNYFKIEINWSSGADSNTTWEMTAALEADGTLRYTDCHCYETYYRSIGSFAGTSFTETRYVNGKGYFTRSDGNLIWNNVTENQYNYCCFK